MQLPHACCRAVAHASLCRRRGHSDDGSGPRKKHLGNRHWVWMFRCRCGCALVGCAHDPFSINLLAAVGAPSPSSSASPWAPPWVQWLRRQTTTKSVSTTCPPSPSPSPTLLRFMATYDQVQPASCSPPSRMLPSLASPCYSTAQSSCGLTQSKQRMHSVSTQVNQPTHCPTA